MRICVMELVRRPGYMKLSLHDDIESLEPETSGRRRTGWRSRNPSAFETWPDYRGAPGNQRGASPNASGSLMSQQVLHRDNFYHPDLEIFGSHGWWVSPAAARQSRGRGTSNQRGGHTNQRGAHANQRVDHANQSGEHASQGATTTNQRWVYAYQRERGAYANQRGTNASQHGMNTNQRGVNANQRGTNANQRVTNANQRGTNANQRGTNANQRGMNASQHGTNTNQRGMNANQRETNANQRGTNANQRGTNANQRVTNANQRGINVNQRGMNANQRETNANQRVTNANQRETNANQRDSNANQRETNANQRGTNANQRGTNANQRGTFPYLRGSQRGANANQRGLASQRGIPNNRRPQTSPRQANQGGTQAHQRGLPRSQGSRSRSGVSANRGGSSLNRRGESAIRGRTSSSHQGANVNQGRSSLERTTPGRQRETSPRGPNPLRNKLWPLNRRQPMVREQSPRSSLLPGRASVSDSALGQAKNNLAHQHGTLSAQRRTPVGQRRSPVGQRRPLTGRRQSLADQSGSSVGQRGSLTGRRQSLADQSGSSVGQRGSLTGRRQSLADQSESSVGLRQTPVDQRESPVGQRESPAAQRRFPGDQRKTAADQHEMPQQPKLSATKSPSLRRGDSSLPKVTFEEPPRQKSRLKQLVARWRSKIAQRKVKAQKDESTATSEQETEKDTQTPEILRHEELRKGETDAKGLDPDSLMFRDGLRRIDMVIAFIRDVGRDGKEAEAEARHQRRRSIFQAKLIEEGLELELEHESLSFNGKIWFLKVHIPWETQLRIAEVIGLKRPTKAFIPISVKTWTDQEIANYQKRWYVRLRQRFYKTFALTRISPEPSFYMTSKNYRREEQFLVKDRHTEFSSAQRSLLVMQILVRAKYDDGSNQFGINRLLAAQTYKACFPLHEGEYNKCMPDGTYTDRQLLYLEWVCASNWNKKQPLWLVQRYFGDQIGLYYAWLGFYTRMLIVPATVGSLCFLYGIISEKSGDNIPSQEICDANGVGNITLCPLCDKACSYQKLHEACIFAQITYLIDNPATVFFAVFMCFWANIFLVMWKREESVFKWQWDLARSDPDENPRPEYEASVTSTRINPITGTREPYRGPWQNFIRRVAVSTVVLMMVSISLGTVIGVITYRIAMVAVIYRGSGGILRKYARLFTAFTGALINLAVSEILIKIFTEVALVITNLESPRTQSDYEDSVTFKMFIFEFINFYAHIMYIAFFKGTFYNYPGDKQARKSPFLTIKGDICFQAGCLAELGIMLAVSMIGRQAIGVGILAFFRMKNWWRSHWHRSQTLDLSKPYLAWERDYHLQNPGRMALFEEYLEIIIQYGFITLFGAAFPLAPLFALISNICEIRMDAYKMVTQSRRPLPDRVEDIGAWYGNLQFLTYLGVVSNAFVLSYTSDFVPRMVFKLVYSPDHTLTGYVNHSLSWFNTSDFLSDWGADDSEWDPPQCAYRGYRNPPEHPNPYGLSPYYWHVFAARLSFIVVFEHLVFSVNEVIRAIIPKVPTELLRQIRREVMLEEELKYEGNLNSTDVEYFKSMAEEKDHNTVKSGDAGVTINWKDEASKKDAF